MMQSKMVGSKALALCFDSMLEPQFRVKRHNFFLKWEVGWGRSFNVISQKWTVGFRGSPLDFYDNLRWPSLYDRQAHGQAL